VLAGGETPLISGPGLFVVGGDAVVHAVAGVIDASDHAEVFASDRAAVRARGHARIWIEGDVHADAYDSAVVIAKGRCRVRAADRVRVWARDRVLVTCEGDFVWVRWCAAESPQLTGRGRVAPWTPSEARPQ
jgi:uncharacterized protein (DUF2345 family)